MQTENSMNSGGASEPAAELSTQLAVQLAPAWAAIVQALGAQQMPAGTLYVVATPIGNLADISLRALAVLACADVIAAEDTRHTRSLIERYGLSKPLLACHEHNEREAAQNIVARLQQGQRVAYVSDAGTPGISDPGARLVSAVRAAGCRVVPVPGASALVAAASTAGFESSALHFAGFLPAKREARARAIEALASLKATLVFYEAPHRVRETVEALCDGLGGARDIVIAREITKLHEQIEVMPLSQAAAWFETDAHHERGEFVLLVQGAPDHAGDAVALDAVLAPLVRELPVKQAVALAVEITGEARNMVYARALALRATD
jgi:16S rRNA (cytidine1402-2'-O)-methyltransferase